MFTKYARFVDEYNSTSINKFPESATQADIDLTHHLLSLSAEVGELQSIISKTYRGKARSYYHEVEELGDILFHVVALCNYYNISPEQLAERNRAKLERRYKNNPENISDRYAKAQLNSAEATNFQDNANPFITS